MYVSTYVKRLITRFYFTLFNFHHSLCTPRFQHITHIITVLFSYRSHNLKCIKILNSIFGWSERGRKSEWKLQINCCLPTSNNSCVMETRRHINSNFWHMPILLDHAISNFSYTHIMRCTVGAILYGAWTRCIFVYFDGSTLSSQAMRSSTPNHKMILFFYTFKSNCV